MEGETLTTILGCAQIAVQTVNFIILWKNHKELKKLDKRIKEKIDEYERRESANY